MEKNNKEKKFQFRELFTNKQYRSIAILIFYAVLFAILIVMLRMPSSGTDLENGTHVTKVKGFELINNNNFSYKYTVMVDDERYIFEGKKFEDKDMLTLIKDDEKREYYLENNKYYVKENDKFVSIIEKPFLIFDFFNTDVLDMLITRSILVDEVANRYRIDNQDLYDVLSPDNSKVDSGENYITLNYRNSNITRIVFELDNYSKTIGENYSKVIITLEYFDFNLIDDFNDITVE
jgi:hypothetical protein